MISNMNVFTKLAQIRQEEVGPEVNTDMLIGGTVGGLGGSVAAGLDLKDQKRRIRQGKGAIKAYVDADKGFPKMLLGMLNNLNENVPKKINYARAANLGLLGLAGGTLTGAIASTFGADDDKDKYVESTNTNNPSTQQEA